MLFARELARLNREHGVQHFLFASSTSVYGPGGTFDEASVCNPVGPYSQSKYAAEQAVIAASARGLNATIARLGTVFGFAPAIRFDALPNRFAYLAAVGKPVTIHGDGNQVRPLIHVGDACSAIRMLLHSPAVGCQVFNVATDCYSPRQVGAAIAESVSSVRIMYTDQDVLTHFSLEVDTERIRERGWRASQSLVDGLREVAERLGPFQSTYNATVEMLQF